MSAQPREALEMWTVYERPKEYPQGFLARRWIVTDIAMATETYYTAPTLSQVRECLPGGLFCQPRAELDDPAIVETWF
ncbi:hypothetical protein ACS7SF_02715 [Ralstonia sp. 25C]|uniref:hypothetical protein n=1 Tax=Ralstonia sp. 25C TaxID=3447363 RepID=UPI003F74B00E